MLEITDLHVKYGEFDALKGVSLEVKEGQIVALLGSNGAGKSTTINAVSGMIQIARGSIQFEGNSITELPGNVRVMKGIVQVPEGRKLFPSMSVMDNLLIGAYLPGAKSKLKDTLAYCFELFPILHSRKNQLAGSLSGGEQQMCAISRALMSQPKLLMLDEPSLGLAPIIVEKIFEVIRIINRAGMTIFLVEQNAMASLEISDQAYVIETGENMLSGTGAELLSHETLRESYLGL